MAQQLQQAPGTQARPGQPGQRDRATTQPARQGQQYTAEFRGTQTAGGQASKEIEHYLANCLLIKNKAEVELGQFAQQKAQNPEVKEFAQMLVKDHQQAIQKLQALAGTQGAAGNAQRPGANGQLDAQANTPATERPRQGLNQDADQSSTTSTRPGAQNDALAQLLQLDRQISERCQEMVREELQAKSGPEFDYCFVGAQIGSHTHMLAALDVIGQRAQGELRQFVQEAQPVVQQHLEHAKQLAKTQMQAQTGARTGSQAERQPGQPQTQQR
jgi:predicted outer membrane protein